MAIAKADVEQWIKELVPYVIKPVILAPKGSCNGGLKKVQPGDLVEYDITLIPGKPDILDYTATLKILVELYSLVITKENVFPNEDEYQKIKEISLDEK